MVIGLQFVAANRSRGIGFGMAAGGRLAGVLCEHDGTYAPAFAAGVAANCFDRLVIGLPVARQRWYAGTPVHVAAPT